MVTLENGTARVAYHTTKDRAALHRAESSSDVWFGVLAGIGHGEAMHVQVGIGLAVHTSAVL